MLICSFFLCDKCIALQLAELWNICHNHNVNKIFKYFIILCQSIKKLWLTSCVKKHLVTHQDSAEEESSQRRFSASWEVPRDYPCTPTMSQNKHSSRREEKKLVHPVVMQIQSALPDVYFSAPCPLWRRVGPSGNVKNQYHR